MSRIFPIRKFNTIFYLSVCLWEGEFMYFLILKFYLQEVILLILLFSTNENLVFLNKPSLHPARILHANMTLKFHFMCVFINVKLAEKYVKQLKDNELSFREFIRHLITFGMKLIKLSQCISICWICILSICLHSTKERGNKRVCQSRDRKYNTQLRTEIFLFLWTGDF